MIDDTAQRSCVQILPPFTVRHRWVPEWVESWGAAELKAEGASAFALALVRTITGTIRDRAGPKPAAGA